MISGLLSGLPRRIVEPDDGFFQADIRVASILSLNTPRRQSGFVSVSARNFW